jgi:XTP/dITP diphosphohydrolase
MSEPAILILGTRNRKKAAYLIELLQTPGLRLATLADFPGAIDVIEDGETFAANAEKKAVQQARHLGRWVLGEDSGLQVDALQGRPGVYSARYAGPDATDERNNQKLLAELAGVPLPQRTARYVCSIALADPQGHIRARAEASCHGRITLQPRGTAGFGYDPLFEIPEYHRTFGELGPVVKSVLSHRRRAVEQLRRPLLLLLPELASGTTPPDAGHARDAGQRPRQAGARP